jgi:hypothetical protein
VTRLSICFMTGKAKGSGDSQPFWDHFDLWNNLSYRKSIGCLYNVSRRLTYWRSDQDYRTDLYSRNDIPSTPSQQVDGTSMSRTFILVTKPRSSRCIALVRVGMGCCELRDSLQIQHRVDIRTTNSIFVVIEFRSS